MKNYILFFCLLCISVKIAKTQSKLDNRDLSLIPINYDFSNLHLYLNSSINNQTSEKFWRWDYLNSDNAEPDSTGIEHYMNINQPLFIFEGVETLPALYIVTYKNKIVEFSAITITYLADKNTL